MSAYWIGGFQDFGKIKFYKKDGKIYCDGEHISKKDNKTYLKIYGEVTIVDELNLIINGQITTNNLFTTQEETRSSIYEFKKTEKTDYYWRLVGKYELRDDEGRIKGYCDVDIFGR